MKIKLKRRLNNAHFKTKQNEWEKQRVTEIENSKISWERDEQTVKRKMHFEIPDITQSRDAP